MYDPPTITTGLSAADLRTTSTALVAYDKQGPTGPSYGPETGPRHPSLYHPYPPFQVGEGVRAQLFNRGGRGRGAGYMIMGRPDGTEFVPAGAEGPFGSPLGPETPLHQH